MRIKGEPDQRLKPVKRGMKFSRSDFEMQRFESRRPRLRVLANFDSGMQRFESRRPKRTVCL